MRRSFGLLVPFTAALLGFILGCASAQAQCINPPCKPLQYHGGPVLEDQFTIYPFYYGNWSSGAIKTQQKFLKNLAAYMSGKNAPTGQQPMTRQYGVNQVKIAAPVTATGKPASSYESSCVLDHLSYYQTPPAMPPAPGTLYFCDVPEIIRANQGPNQLPSFGPHTFILMFPSAGFSLDPTCNCLGYHSGAGGPVAVSGGDVSSTSEYFGIVPQFSVQGPYADAQKPFQVVTSHEVFEASTDPADDTLNAWDEAADQCNTTVTLDWAGAPAGKLQFASITDNTMNGACSTSGYTSQDEIQVYGWTYTDYRAKYDELFPQGWRLYSLQSYVTPAGDVLYNAVWRPGGDADEIQEYGVTFDQFISKYNTIFPEGWRVEILQAYVLPDQEVLYNAVWRRGTATETQIYGVPYSDYRSQYDTLFPQGWRLYILQSYVVSGNVLYNAVWRKPDLNIPPCPCNDPQEIQLYEYTYSDYRTKYNELFAQGWRLYLLQAYVLPDGTVRYNAVFRQATHAEVQAYGDTYEAYRAKYDALFPQGWRLYILDSYVGSDGTTRYNAVWQRATIDRPR